MLKEESIVHQHHQELAKPPQLSIHNHTMYANLFLNKELLFLKRQDTWIHFSTALFIILYRMLFQAII